MSCGEYCSTHGCHGGIGCAAHRTHYKPEPQSSWPVRFGDLAMVVIMVLAIFYMLGVVGPALDAKPYQESPELVAAERAALAEFKRDAAAAKACRASYPNSRIRWTSSGELVCVSAKS